MTPFPSPSRHSNLRTPQQRPSPQLPPKLLLLCVQTVLSSLSPLQQSSVHFGADPGLPATFRLGPLGYNSPTSSSLFFLFWLPYFLEPQDTPSSSYRFPAPVLELAIDPRFLFLENDVRNHDLSARCTHCYGRVIASTLSQLTDKEIFFLFV